MEFNDFNKNPMISTPQITSYSPMVPPLPPASLYTCSDYALIPDGSMGRNNIIPDYYGGVSHENLKERMRQEIYADMKREKAWKEEVRRDILMEREKAWKEEIRREILMESGFSAQKVMYADMAREKALKEEIMREILMERDFLAPKTMLPDLSNTKDYREGSVSRLSDFIDNNEAREKMPFQRHPEAAMAAKAELAARSVKEPKSKKKVLPRIGFGTMKQEFRCDLCQFSLPSAIHLDKHKYGKKHQAKVLMEKDKMMLPKNPNDGDFIVGSVSRASGLVYDGVKQKMDPQSANKERSSFLPKANWKSPPTISSGKTRKQDFRCTLCELSLKSKIDLQAHIRGKKHQEKVSDSEIKHKATPDGKSLKEGITQEGHADVARVRASARELEANALKVELAPQSAGERSLHLPKPNSKLLFRCALCELSMGSARDLEAHIRGKRHQAKVLESKIEHKATSNGEPLKEGTRQVIYADAAWE